ncbi:MAG: hypothetical protein HXS48_05650 [Theionarchaea archaeon]|nr:hypothetical protein [Theionarchaea archaeon]
MDEEGFKKFLKRGGRSQSALERALSYVREFEQFLQEYRNVTLEEVTPEDLEAFVEWIEEKPGISAYQNYLDSPYEGIIPVIKPRADLKDKTLKKLKGYQHLYYGGIRNILLYLRS